MRRLAGPTRRPPAFPRVSGLKPPADRRGRGVAIREIITMLEPGPARRLPAFPRVSGHHNAFGLSTSNTQFIGISALIAQYLHSLLRGPRCDSRP